MKRKLAVDVEVVDTTGAGDGFVSGILYNLNNLDKKIFELNRNDLVITDYLFF